MNNIEFREPVIEDAEAIVAFYNRVGGETSYLSFEKDEYPRDVKAERENIEETNAHATSTMLLALDAGKIVAIGTISSGNKIKARHEGELGIVVEEAHQGQGIGSEIIRRLIEFSRGNGVTTRIRLDTRTDNRLAVKLYISFGFEIEGCLKNSTLLDGVYYDLYVMGLML
ncbi:MAG: GNAT family protein [Lachnospiraceae bacterium]